MCSRLLEVTEEAGLSSPRYAWAQFSRKTFKALANQPSAKGEVGVVDISEVKGSLRDCSESIPLPTIMRWQLDRTRQDGVSECEGCV